MYIYIYMYIFPTQDHISPSILVYEEYLQMARALVKANCMQLNLGSPVPPHHTPPTGVPRS